MKRTLFILLIMCMALAAASVAFAQAQFYCVKPDGTPMAGILMPQGTQDDPADVCNAVVPQCFLTCGAVAEYRYGGAQMPPPNLPIITVTPQMLPKSRNQYQYESPAYCNQQLQACVASCGGNQDCVAACRSVRSGCGTGNPGGRHIE